MMGEIQYVIYNSDIGLFFSGFGNGIYSKFLHKAKIFYSYGYCCSYLRYLKTLGRCNGFKVCSYNQVAKEVLLYA